jgi:hypothetical protein
MSVLEPPLNRMAVTSTESRYGFTEPFVMKWRNGDSYQWYARDKRTIERFREVFKDFADVMEGIR